MADELDSGSSARKGVWVQVPSSAYDKKKVSGFCLRLFFLQSEASLEPKAANYLKSWIVMVVPFCSLLSM